MPTDQIVTAGLYLDRLLQEAIDAPAKPQIVLEGDTARTRKGDPETSHRAADRSQANVHATREAVLKLVAIHEPITGSGINEQYSLVAGRAGFPKVHHESPRKRAEEMAKDGLLQVHRDKRGTEGVYSLTDIGREAVQA